MTSQPQNSYAAFAGLFVPTPSTSESYGLARFVDSKPAVQSGLFGSAYAQVMNAPNALRTTGALEAQALIDALAKRRRRASWNDRFEHWAKPASETEERAIDRAERLVRAAIGRSAWLTNLGVTVEPQGSAHNNTNTRNDADVDLRVMLPYTKVDFHPNVVPQWADTALGYQYPGVSLPDLFYWARHELRRCLAEEFGESSVEPGNKAIRLKGVLGSRAEVDIVPAVQHHNVMWWANENRYNTIQAVAILSATGDWTINYPDRHRANGVAKRARTQHRFKRIVRIFKRLRGDMSATGLLKFKVPSFLVECLVYAVEDQHFLVASDDHFTRVRRVALRLRQLLTQPAAMSEINGLKRLFGPEQAWTPAQATAFVNCIILHVSR